MANCWVCIGKSQFNEKENEVLLKIFERKTSYLDYTLSQGKNLINIFQHKLKGIKLHLDLCLRDKMLSQSEKVHSSKIHSQFSISIGANKTIILCRDDLDPRKLVFRLVLSFPSRHIIFLGFLGIFRIWILSKTLIEVHFIGVIRNIAVQSFILSIIGVVHHLHVMHAIPIKHHIWILGNHRLSPNIICMKRNSV